MFKSQKQWEDFTESEIAAILPTLQAKGIELLKTQPHISGERYLMSGRKIVLIGRQIDSSKKIIIKTSADKPSLAEIEHERITRVTLESLPFAYHPLLAPKELWSEKIGERVIVAAEYIEQPVSYLSLPLEQQFDLILQAFTMLEGVHATTAAHTKSIQNIFGVWRASDYLKSAGDFVAQISNTDCIKSPEPYQQAIEILCQSITDVERYCDFLTHDDFALHNFRFNDNKIYLIDHASLIFGNKHESWARFMNYMLLYNRDLEQALVKYLNDNTAPEETASLRLMRIYKALELICYHCQATNNAEGNLRELSKQRVSFWTELLKALISDQPLNENIITDYKNNRDSLRSTEELARQKELQQLT
ncbi:hypothetical protein H6784_02580 [Candidatus Nomurabacteria bacterium]|nr:hypothetical protein [Candidatus Kaiserbacteria bacterium]MCB9814283.1 hypothetical protein [Candidatus Nomurabacteria bacterium]